MCLWVISARTYHNPGTDHHKCIVEVTAFSDLTYQMHDPDHNNYHACKPECTDVLCISLFRAFREAKAQRIACPWLITGGHRPHIYCHNSRQMRSIYFQCMKSTVLLAQSCLVKCEKAHAVGQNSE